MGKAANATDYWPNLQTTSGAIWRKPVGEDAKLEELVGWIRGKVNAPPESIALVAKNPGYKGSPKLEYTMEALSKLTTEGNPQTLLQAQNLIGVSPSPQDGRYPDSHDAQCGVSEGMGLFETQDCFIGAPHYRAIDIGDAISLHEKAYTSMGEVEPRDANQCVLLHLCVALVCMGMGRRSAFRTFTRYDYREANYF